MSAWVVTKAHIDYMVTAALEAKMIGSDEVDAVGQMWWNMNRQSVAYRYNEPVDLVTYEWDPVADIDPVQVIKAAQCYEYQSCENHGEWERSAAQRACHRLVWNFVHLVPGYDMALWGIEESDVTRPNVRFYPPDYGLEEVGR